MNSSPLQAKVSDATRAFSSLAWPVLTYGVDIRVPVDFVALEKSIPAEVPSAVLTEDHSTHWSGPLSSALVKFPHLSTKIFSSVRLDNKLEAWHLSRVHDIRVIVVHASATATPTPIYLTSTSSSFSHVFILLEKNAQAHIEHRDSPSTNPFQSEFVEILAEENARADYISFQNNPLKHRFLFKRAHVEKDAHVNWHWSLFNSAFSKVDVSSHLLQTNASTKNNGLFVQNNSQVSDMDARAYHAAPHTHSYLNAWGILDGNSQNVYRGTINVTKAAPAAIGKQRADLLLISPSAEADPVPILEIEGSDVKCSHAATVGRLDKEKLFYLMSRGLDETAARALYLKGFAERFIHSLPANTALQPLIEKEVDALLHLHLPGMSIHPSEVSA